MQAADFQRAFIFAHPGSVSGEYYPRRYSQTAKRCI